MTRITRVGEAAQVGSRLGCYLLEGKLGKGGMGEVYLARDPRASRGYSLGARGQSS